MMVSGNMTGPNLDTYYSRVILLCSMYTIVFPYEFNNIETCTGDISNAYLNERTTYNILFNYGYEFEPFLHAGHLILINTKL